jgi:predicted ester cyclase
MSLLAQAKQFFIALDSHDLDKAVTFIAPSANIRTPIGSFIGPEAFREWMLMIFRAIPNFTHKMGGIAVEADNALAFELHVTGTMTGPLAMPNGDLPPTGKSFDILASDFWRFENGLIVEYHAYLDRLDFFRQLGLTPPDED